MLYEISMDDVIEKYVPEYLWFQMLLAIYGDYACGGTIIEIVDCS